MHCSLETRATALNRISQKRIGELLNKIPGLKDFIIEPNLIKPLERIIGVSQLRLVFIWVEFGLLGALPVLLLAWAN